MGLEKAIKSGKEKRKPFVRSKSFDRHCRNNGACEWCRGNRTHNDKKRKMRAEVRAGGL